ncbi:DUF418 domain-containing protein [Tumebacillus sp. DT12]|uniref:DUF418 domain-containing protein n=1 Tax=Tumebacillus lacus TaxID=2995335 RepID=A0ABT3X4H6_9BACL|nr:DUF418 domain-containing protein [Tumebacillus lacus]MCX7571802.1 DUF418 domain-containing protein [Tumebacillus lacus]
MSQMMEPIRTEERIGAVDMMRGFFILWILVVNMLLYGAPYELSGQWEWAWSGDVYAEMFIEVFAAGKSITMLSFLFGFGMIIMKERADARGTAFFPVYARRMLALLLFGATHAFLIWYGDILLFYGMLGIVMLLFFSGRTAQTLLIWALVLTGLTVVVLLLFTVIWLAMMALAGGELEDSLNQTSDQVQLLISAYSGGSWSEIFAARYEEWVTSFGTAMIYLPELLVMMLLGAWTAKKGILHNAAEHLGFFRKVRLWSLLVGGVLTLLPVLLYVLADAGEQGVLLARFWSTMIGSPLIGLVYGTTLVLLWQRGVFRRGLRVLARVGRMAFSVYILQSLLATTLFYSYGFGLYGSIGPAKGLLITLAFYAVLIPFAVWWTGRFRYGPLEWLWRTMTYGKRP